MTCIAPTLNDKYNEEFFNELAKELERVFPKGEKCSCGKRLPCRSGALVFNSMANIIFHRLLIKFGDEIIDYLNEKSKSTAKKKSR